MSGWGSLPSINMSGWRSAPSEAWRAKKIALGRADTFPKRTAATLTEEGRPTKRRAIEKYMLFNLLRMYTINVIDMCHVELEHCTKTKDVTTRINSTCNTVLRASTYHNWGNLMNFGKLLSYNKIRCKRSGRNYVKSTYGWEQNTHLVKHKHGWMNQIPSRNIIHNSSHFHISYTQNIYTILLWRHTRWTWSSAITRTHFYYTCISISRIFYCITSSMVQYLPLAHIRHRLLCTTPQVDYHLPPLF